nr:patatin-like phospholipase family protein [Ardenticatena sp.]
MVTKPDMALNLRRVPFFSLLPEQTLLAIARQLRRVSYSKGDIVFLQGEPGDAMYFIESGQVEVVASQEDGKETVLAQLGPGSFFGEVALLLGGTRSATVRVVIDAVLLQLHKDDLEALLHAHPVIAVNMSRELSLRLRRTIHGESISHVWRLVALLADEPTATAFIQRFETVSAERVLLVDLTRAEWHPEQWHLSNRVDWYTWHHENPLSLPTFLSDNAAVYDRIIMLISPADTLLNRTAAGQADVVIELHTPATYWLASAAGGVYWYAPPEPRHVEYMARKLARKTVGLVLSSGNARGVAHIGVIEVLEEAGVPVDVIAGTSMGALVGGLYAAGYDAEGLREFAAHLPRATSWRSGLYDIAWWPRHGFIKGEKARHYLAERWFHHKTFRDLERRLYVVAADLMTGQEVVFHTGPVTEAVWASACIPGIFQPLFYNGRYLVDGAAVNPIPTSVIEREVDITIVVSVIPSLAERRTRRNVVRTGRLPNMIHILMGMQEIMGAVMLEHQTHHSGDIFLRPDVADIGSFDYNRWETLIARGRSAAEAALDAIERLLRPQVVSLPLSVLS